MSAGHSIPAWTLIAAAAALSGCSVSRAHLGFHNFGDGKLGFSVVGAKYVRPLRDQEDLWMYRVANLELEKLSEDFTDDLAAALGPEVREKLIPQIQRDYRPNGAYQRRSFPAPAFSTGKGARTDVFSYYDMVGFSYLMEGKVSGNVQFYVTRVDGAVRICGLEIVPVRESDRETAKEVRFLFPGSVNQAGVQARPGSVIERP